MPEGRLKDKRSYVPQSKMSINDKKNDFEETEQNLYFILSIRKSAECVNVANLPA